jgi:hypothetical protein
VRERVLDDFFEARLIAEAAARKAVDKNPLLVYAMLVMIVLASGFLIVSLLPKPRFHSDVVQTQNDIIVVEQAVQSLYADQASFDGLSDKTIIESGTLPSGMVRDGLIESPVGGVIVMRPDDNGFAVRIINVPGWACAELAQSPLADRVLQVTASADGITRTSSGTPLTVKDSARACGRAFAPASVEWVFP